MSGKNIFTAFLAILLPLICCGQQYSASYLAKELTEGSCAVIRQNNSDYVYKDKTQASVRYSFVVTVLNREGEDFAFFHLDTWKNVNLKSFTGEIYDRNGRLMRKIKKSDLQITQYSEGLADDVSRIYYQPRHASYPFTVKYDFEVQLKGGIFGLTLFAPVPYFGVAVESAVSTLTLPADCGYKLRHVNILEATSKPAEKGMKKYTWSIGNFRAIKQEPFAPPPRTLTPLVLFSPDEVLYEGHSVWNKSWESYGNWLSSLLEKRDDLPAPLKATVAELTSGAESDMEKIKILYDYLGRTTRYVSIQLGIGGLQPMKAADVYKNKFGDCKALTNYLMAILRECGIESYYTEIGIGKRRIYKDFVTATQTNHAILCVPVANDTLWLECTNPEYPFGYVHSSIAGNDALVCHDGGMEHVTLPEIPAHTNRKDQRIEITLDKTGRAVGRCEKTYGGFYFESMMAFGKMTAQERINTARKEVSIPVAVIDNLTFSAANAREPLAIVSFDVDAKQYGHTGGSRYFLPVNPFRSNPLASLPQKRENDIYIHRTYSFADNITINLPPEINVESLPRSVSMSNKFGSCLLEVKQDGNAIVIVQSFGMNAGMFSKEDYAELQILAALSENLYSSRIVLKRAE